MTDDTRALRGRLLAMARGMQLTQAIHAFTKLRLADIIGSGRRTAAELAAEAGADPAALNRLLRALAAAGILDEDSSSSFALTPLGDGLRTDAPGSLAGWTLFAGSEGYWANWGRFSDSVRTGKTGWQVSLGIDAWTYRARHPEARRLFDQAMVSLTDAFAGTIAEDFDFGRFHTVVDVGGGRGTLLAQILDRSRGLRGILFDQSEVIEAAPAFLSERGVLDRCEVVGGSFFDSVPSGGDAYVLKSIIHDWYDPDATRILRTVRAAMRPGGVLLVVEAVLEPPNQGLPGKLSDLNMLVGPGGVERTREEFEVLFEAGGFRLAEVHPTQGPFFVLESAPV